MASRQGFKLVVKNLPWTVGNQELREYFSQFGHVAFSKVMFDKTTGFSLRHGFVRFNDEGHAANALESVIAVKMDSLQGEELELSFSKATAHMAGITGKLSGKDLLYFYSRYKQANEGPCCIPRPGFFDIQGKQKWEAWKSLKDMSKTNAMREYIEKLSEVDPDWESGAPFKTGWVSVSRMVKEEAVKEQDKDIFDYVQENNLQKVKSFNINDLELVDANKMTPLHWACDRGHTDIVEFLLKNTQILNNQDADGQTPLHYAASCGHETIVKLLLENGALKNLKDTDGLLPYDCAEEQIKSMLKT